jgi:hypothetical protein
MPGKFNDSDNTAKVSICVDCLIWAANGDLSAFESEDEASEFVARYNLGLGDAVLTLGMFSRYHECQTHTDLDEFGYVTGACLDGTCECPTAGDDGNDCYCEQLGFSWSPCEICNSGLGGDRHAATIWF